MHYTQPSNLQPACESAGDNSINVLLSLGAEIGTKFLNSGNLARLPRSYRVHEIKHDGAFLLDCTARPFRKSDVTPQAGQRKRPGSRFSATAPRWWQRGQWIAAIMHCLPSRLFLVLIPRPDHL